MKFNNKFLPWMIIPIMILLPYFQSVGQDLGKYQALYIYNFTKYIEWPNASEQLVIGAIGSGTIHRELEKMVSTKGGGKLKFIKLSSYDNLDQCNIIFLTKEQDRNLKLVLEKTKGKSVLIISETESSASRGAGISFFLDKEKLKFAINKNALEQRKMKVSSSLLSLAKIVK